MFDETRSVGLITCALVPALGSIKQTPSVSRLKSNNMSSQAVSLCVPETPSLTAASPYMYLDRSLHSAESAEQGLGWGLGVVSFPSSASPGAIIRLLRR